MYQLFDEIPIPHYHRNKTAARRGRWYSWSPAFLQAIAENLERSEPLPRPGSINVRGCDPYNTTYTYRLSALPDRLVHFAIEAGRALLAFRLDHEMRFLSSMLQPPVSSVVLHKIFALIRSGIVQNTKDGRTALHAPVKTKRKDDGFPLHFDLFLTDKLWLVFDNVPAGRAGRALFLSRAAFEKALLSNRLMPEYKRRRVFELLRATPTEDSFDECYELIHSEEHPWTRLLENICKRESFAIKLRSGEGYIINDRNWLHGRTPVKGAIPANRFRRLVYGTKLHWT